MKRMKPVFAIMRLKPDEAAALRRCLSSEEGAKIPKSYNITNDTQRLQFVQQVARKELTIKEVFFFRYQP